MLPHLMNGPFVELRSLLMWYHYAFDHYDAKCLYDYVWSYERYGPSQYTEVETSSPLDIGPPSASRTPSYQCSSSVLGSWLLL